MLFLIATDEQTGSLILPYQQCITCLHQNSPDLSNPAFQPWACVFNVFGKGKFPPQAQGDFYLTELTLYIVEAVHHPPRFMSFRKKIHRCSLSLHYLEESFPTTLFSRCLLFFFLLEHDSKPCSGLERGKAEIFYFSLLFSPHSFHYR